MFENSQNCLIIIKIHVIFSLKNIWIWKILSYYNFRKEMRLFEGFFNTVHTPPFLQVGKKSIRPYFLSLDDYCAYEFCRTTTQFFGHEFSCKWLVFDTMNHIVSPRMIFMCFSWVTKKDEAQNSMCVTHSNFPE